MAKEREEEVKKVTVGIIFFPFSLFPFDIDFFPPPSSSFLLPPSFFFLYQAAAAASQTTNAAAVADLSLSFPNFLFTRMDQ